MQEMAVKKLQAVPMFARLSEAQLALIVPFFQFQRYRKGQVIAQQGQHHNALFVIAKGRVSIGTQLFSDRTVMIAELGENAVFGEISLFLPGPSSATVQACQATACFALSHDHFHVIQAAFPDIATVLNQYLVREMCRRIHETVARAAYKRLQDMQSIKLPKRLTVAKPKPKKIPDKKLPEYLGIFKQLGMCAAFTTDELVTLLQHVKLVQYSKGQIIYREQDTFNGCCYFIVHGAVLTVKGEHRNALKVNVFGPGSLFGELEFLDEKARLFTSIARERITCLQIDFLMMRKLSETQAAFCKKFYDLVYQQVARLMESSTHLMTRIAAQQQLRK